MDSENPSDYLSFSGTSACPFGSELPHAGVVAAASLQGHLAYPVSLRDGRRSALLVSSPRRECLVTVRDSAHTGGLSGVVLQHRFPSRA
jgi:hypothetical protein